MKKVSRANRLHFHNTIQRLDQKLLNAGLIDLVDRLDAQVDILLVVVVKLQADVARLTDGPDAEQQLELAGSGAMANMEAVVAKLQEDVARISDGPDAEQQMEIEDAIDVIAEDISDQVLNALKPSYLEGEGGSDDV